MRQRKAAFLKGSLGLSEQDASRVLEVDDGYVKQAREASQNHDMTRVTELSRERDLELQNLLGNENYARYSAFQKQETDAARRALLSGRAAVSSP